MLESVGGNWVGVVLLTQMNSPFSTTANGVFMKHRSNQLTPMLKTLMAHLMAHH